MQTTETPKVQYITRRAPYLSDSMAAVGAEQAGRDRIGRADHAGGRDVEAVDADQVARQPQRQRHEGAEDEEIVEREAPDLDVLERLEHRPRALAASRRCARRAASSRIVLGGEPEDDRHHRDARPPRPARPPASRRRP